MFYEEEQQRTAKQEIASLRARISFHEKLAEERQLMQVATTAGASTEEPDQPGGKELNINSPAIGA